VTQRILETGLISGDTLTLSASLIGTKVSAGGQILARVIYQNGTTDKLRIPVPTGTYAATQISDTLTVSGDVVKIKVKVAYKGATGRFQLDDLLLTTDGQIQSGGNLVPLPDAIQPQSNTLQPNNNLSIHK
jgi:hypothetical protein